MKLSTRAHYGLRAIVAIVKLSDGEGSGEPRAVSVMDISKSEGISDTYLEQLISKLRKNGLLRSFRGAKGGYVLTRSPEEITVADVIHAVGEKITISDCTEEEGCERAKERGSVCPSGCFWQMLSEEMDKLAEKTTVADLIRAEKESARK